MKIAHKLTLAVMALCFASPLMAASGFTQMPHPTDATFGGAEDSASTGCTMDAEGDIYYVLKGHGFYHQKKDRSTPIKLQGLDDLVGARMGIHIDTTNDSIWVGGVDGKVRAGKLVNGVVSKWDTLPSIPLLYSRLVVAGLIKFTHVNDFVKDLQGRLLAATDSLAWRLENGAWVPLGVATDYGDYWYGVTEIATLYPTGEIFTSQISNSWYMEMIKPDGTVSCPWGCGTINSQGISVGEQSHLMRFGGGGTDSAFYTMAPPFIAPVKHHFDSRNAFAMVTFEDPSGMRWLSQDGLVVILDSLNNVLYKMFTEDLLDNGLNTMVYGFNFFLAKDSTFWLCTDRGPYQYDGKYKIPAEATTASRTISRAAYSFPQVMSKSGGLQITTQTSIPWDIRIHDALGRLAWHGSVKGEQNIPLAPGAWAVQMKHGNISKEIPVAIQ